MKNPETPNHALQRTARASRHLLHRRLSARHAGAAPHSAVELGSLGDIHA